MFSYTDYRYEVRDDISLHFISRWSLWIKKYKGLYLVGNITALLCILACTLILSVWNVTQLIQLMMQLKDNISNQTDISSWTGISNQTNRTDISGISNQTNRTDISGISNQTSQRGNQMSQINETACLSQIQNMVQELEVRIQNYTDLLASVLEEKIDQQDYERMILLDPIDYQIHQAIAIVNSSRTKLGSILAHVNGQASDNPAVSCSHILVINSLSASGYYWIRSPRNGSSIRVYCDFDRKCGCDGSNGWTRVGFFNMSDPTHTCPPNLNTLSSPVKTCGRGLSAANLSCTHISYDTLGINYNRVCGRIIAYQHGSLEGLKHLVSQNATIEVSYLNGISLTHGPDGSRKHIWSFVGALGENDSFQASHVCECSNNDNWPFSTRYVGSDYFCDTGNHGNNISHTFYRDPLWDGQGCGISSTCCQFNNPPWFCKNISQITTDSLELRICTDNGEDTPIQLLELYVQ